MQILELGFTAYAVTDLARAAQFYENVLGLKRTATWGDAQSGWFEYDIGPGTLAITNMSKEWLPSPQGACVGLEVADFAAAVAHLKQHGVKFSFEPMETPVCHMAVISDPDGSPICVHKRKPVKLPNV